MTFEKVYEEWLKDKRRQVKESTLSAYQLQVKNHIMPEFGDVDITEMSRKRIKDWFSVKLDEATLSVKTLRDILIILKMIINYAGDELELDVPSTSWKMKWPTANKTGTTEAELERYTPQEFRRIVNYCIEHPTPKNLAIMITICTGMRIGEICALQFKDINLEEKTIHISRTIERVCRFSEDGAKMKGTKVVISEPKTINSHRVVPIANDIYPIIKNFCKVSLPDYYVCSCAKKYCEPRSFRVQYRRIMREEVGLDRVLKFHALRHTFASTMIENGVDIKTVSSILGHSDVSITLNIYVHPTKEAKKGAVRKGLSKIFK